jgi:hypothetical protein
MLAALNVDIIRRTLLNAHLPQTQLSAVLCGHRDVFQVLVHLCENELLRSGIR